MVVTGFFAQCVYKKKISKPFIGAYMKHWFKHILLVNTKGLGIEDMDMKH